MKNKAFSCQDSGTCKCVNDDLHGNCSTSSDYLPDKNSTYWISLKADVKSCFLCYAGIRSLLNSCVNASYDKGYGYGQNNTYSKKFQVLMTALNENPNSNNISKYNVFAGLYGPGLYICAYETPEFNIGKLAASVALVAFTGGVGVVFAAPIMTADALLKSQESGDQLSRVGCKKIQTKSGPRPFPRIARPAPSDAKVNGKLAFFVFPATNLFVMSPRVKNLTILQ